MGGSGLALVMAGPGSVGRVDADDQTRPWVVKALAPGRPVQQLFAFRWIDLASLRWLLLLFPCL
jgi:hypothetical protein